MIVIPREQNRPSPTKQAFTLVEIMVAIVIIAILMSLLLPALSKTFTTAKINAVKADMDKLSTGIAAFKTRYGIEPPGSLTFYEAGGAAWLANADAKRSRGLISRISGQFAFGAIDLNQDGDTNDVIRLDGAECLVFFLGGMPNYTTGALTGFSKNPLNPFALGGNREGPFFEFQGSIAGATGAGRLVDLDGDRFPEYLDPISGQQQPYVYFANGYAAQNNGSGQWINVDNWLVAGPANQQRMARAYYLFPINDNTFPGGSNASRPHQANAYQIISPGFDYEYGDGGAFDPNNEQNNAAMSARDADNITNFHPGVLRP